MPYYKGEKWACYSCTKGHRSSKCTHFDRILYKVRKPGRPLNNCPHVLPDSIPPGTFVNTSSESMANGQPPNEACNCKNDLVQVAIPKVKSCSCLKPETVRTMQPTTLPAIQEQTDGVKKGRVSKRPAARRKKSMVSEEAAEAARSEVEKVDSVRADSAGTATEAGINVTTGSSEAKDGWQSFNGLIDPATQQHGVSIVPQDHSAVSNQPLVATTGLNNYWPSSGSPLVSPGIGGIDHLSLSQNGTSTFSPTTSAFNPAFSHIQNGHSNATPFIDPFPKTQSFYGHVPTNLNTIPQIPQQVFPAQQQQQQQQPQYAPLPHLKMPLEGEKGDLKPAASEANVTVQLTQLEWTFIQRARAAGIDLTELSKSFDPNHKSADSSSSNSPYINSAHSSPPGRGCCSGKTMSPPPAPAAAGCCSGNKQPPEEPSTPGSPRCKCGEACRCVPCADHPHNPAMIEHIRQNMELMDSGLYSSVLGGGGGSRVHSGFSPPGTAGYDAYYDDGDDGPEASLADFVIADYRYGVAECRQGNGGCKCGEGCACIGCLTHGGHDGVSLDLSEQKEGG